MKLFSIEKAADLNYYYKEVKRTDPSPFSKDSVPPHNLGACTIKLCSDLNISQRKLECFVTAGHFHPNLIFVTKARTRALLYAW
jgi:hypothetical protein